MIGNPAKRVMRPARRMTRVVTLSQPRAENSVNDRSKAASRTGSGLCKASSRSGSFVSQRYGGTEAELTTGGPGRGSPGAELEEVSEGAALNREGLCDAALSRGLYWKLLVYR
jgi:hypothetical protein